MRLLLTAALAACVVTTPATAQMSPTAQKMGRAMDQCLAFLTSEDRAMNFSALFVAGFEPAPNPRPDLPMRTVIWSEGDEGAEVRYTTHGEGGSCSVGPTRAGYPQMFMQAQVQAWLGRNFFQVGEPTNGDILTADKPSLTPPIEASLLPASPDMALRFSLSRDPW